MTVTGGIFYRMAVVKKIAYAAAENFIIELRRDCDNRRAINDSVPEVNGFRRAE